MNRPLPVNKRNETMAQLSQLLKYRSDPRVREAMDKLYANFPFSIRKAFANLIESQNWISIHSDEEAQEAFQNVMDEINRAMSGDIVDFPVSSLELPFFKNTLQVCYSKNPLEMAKTLAAIIDQERKILGDITKEKRDSGVLMEPDTNYDPRLKDLIESNKSLQRLLDKQVELLQSINCFDNAIQDPARDVPNGVTRGDFIRQLKIGRDSCQASFHKTVEDIRQLVDSEKRDIIQLVDELLDEVNKWKNMQKLAYVRAASIDSVNRLLKDLWGWCGKLGRELWTLYEADKQHEISQSTDELKQLLVRFLQGTVLVTKQPPRSLKMSSSKSGTSREFDLDVSILAAASLSANFTAKMDKVSIFGEKDCPSPEHLHDVQKITACDCNVKTNQVNADGCVVFRQVSLRKFNRPTKHETSNDRVCQQRYRLDFRGLITLGGDFTVPLQAISLPFILNTGANQACEADGALLWFCYNNSVYTPPFNCSLELSMEVVLEMLNSCVVALGGRSLRQSERQYLQTKLTDDSTNPGSSTVKLERFLFDKLQLHGVKENQSFSFWKWFEAILNLIENYLLQPWRDDVIHGFLGRKEVNDMLRHEREGVFLLRFSESYVTGDSQNIAGGLVATVRVSDNIDASGISSALPLGPDIFQKSSLGSLLQNIVHRAGASSIRLLKVLYEKDLPCSAFNKYQSVPHNSEVNRRYFQFKLNHVIESVSHLTIPDESTASSTGSPGPNSGDGGSKAKKRKKPSDGSSGRPSGASPSTPFIKQNPNSPSESQQCAQQFGCGPSPSMSESMSEQSMDECSMGQTGGIIRVGNSSIGPGERTLIVLQNRETIQFRDEKPGNSSKMIKQGAGFTGNGIRVSGVGCSGGFVQSSEVTQSSPPSQLPNFDLMMSQNDQKVSQRRKPNAKMSPGQQGSPQATGPYNDPVHGSPTSVCSPASSEQITFHGLNPQSSSTEQILLDQLSRHGHTFICSPNSADILVQSLSALNQEGSPAYSLSSHGSPGQNSPEDTHHSQNSSPESEEHMQVYLDGAPSPQEIEAASQYEPHQILSLMYDLVHNQ